MPEAPEEPQEKRTEESAALDRVTDYAEERELKEVDKSSVKNAMAKLAAAQRERDEALKLR